jgi:predicted DNA-binding transcriptional regulator YafY
MERELQRYVGRTVEIMYMDRHGKISQRIIEIRAITKHKVRAYCWSKGGPRIFKIENILAAFPASRRIG